MWWIGIFQVARVGAGSTFYYGHWQCPHPQPRCEHSCSLFSCLQLQSWTFDISDDFSARSFEGALIPLIDHSLFFKHNTREDTSQTQGTYSAAKAWSGFMVLERELCAGIWIWALYSQSLSWLAMLSSVGVPSTHVHGWNECFLGGGNQPDSLKNLRDCLFCCDFVVSTRLFISNAFQIL
jgi:hypothetical protein